MHADAGSAARSGEKFARWRSAAECRDGGNSRNRFGHSSVSMMTVSRGWMRLRNLAHGRREDHKEDSNAARLREQALDSRRACGGARGHDQRQLRILLCRARTNAATACTSPTDTAWIHKFRLSARSYIRSVRQADPSSCDREIRATDCLPTPEVRADKRAGCKRKRNMD